MSLQELLKSFEGNKGGKSFDSVKFFSLKDDGDRATVKILIRNEEDILKFARPIHQVEINGFNNKVLCLDNNCECCKAGIKRNLKIMLPLYNTATNQVELWERGINQIHAAGYPAACEKREEGRPRSMFISDHTACRFEEKACFSAHFWPDGAAPPPYSQL